MDYRNGKEVVQLFWTGLLTLVIVAAIPISPGVVMVWKGKETPLVWWLGIVLIGFGVALILAGLLFLPASLRVEGG